MEKNIKRIVEEFKLRSKIFEQETLSKSFFKESDLNRLRAGSQKCKLGLEYSRMCESDDDFLRIVLESDLVKWNKSKKLDMEQEIIEMTKENLRPKDTKIAISLVLAIAAVTVTSLIGVSIPFIVIFGILGFVVGYILGSYLYKLRRRHENYTVREAYIGLFTSTIKVVTGYLKKFKFDLNNRRLILNEFLNYSRKLLQISKNEKLGLEISKFQKSFADIIFSKQSVEGLHLTWKLVLKLNDFDVEKGFGNGFQSRVRHYGNYGYYIKRQYQEIFSPFEIFAKFQEKKSREVRQLLLEVKEFKKALVDDLKTREEDPQKLGIPKSKGAFEGKLKADMIRTLAEEEFPFSEDKLLLQKNGFLDKTKITKIELFKLLQLFFAFSKEKEFRASHITPTNNLDILSNLSSLELSLSNFSEDLMANDYPNIFYPDKVLTTEFIKTTKKYLKDQQITRGAIYASTEGNDRGLEDKRLRNLREDMNENAFPTPKTLLEAKRVTAAGKKLDEMEDLV